MIAKIIQKPLTAILIFSVYPIVFLYSNNISEVYIANIIVPILLSVLSFLSIFKLLSIFLKSKGKAGLITLTFLFVFYSYGHVQNHTEKSLSFIRSGLIDGKLIIFLFFTAIAILLMYLIEKNKKRVNKIVRFINLAGLFLILLLLLNLLGNAGLIKGYKRRTVSDKTIITQDNDLSDIYYIIPDRYANKQVLKEDFNFDNSEFINFLENKGFFVSENSFANYPKTHLSMASSLNMTYLNDLAEKIGKDSEDKKPAFEIVENNKVMQFLKKKGYEFIYFGGWWGPTQQNQYADRNYNLYGKSDDFARLVSGTTLLSLISDSPIARYFPSIASGDEMKRQNIIYQLDTLKKISKEKSEKPKLVIVHLFMPHHPYLFDSSCKPKEFVKDIDEEGQYLKQLKCTNIMLAQTIDSILQNSKKPPIIILQSDEGPFKFNEMYRNGENDIDWTKVSDKAIKHHMLILNTIYLPDKNSLYQGMSPVNTFRIIFNEYFETDYPLLPDKAYFIPHLDKSYDYFEVTDKLSN